MNTVLFCVFATFIVGMHGAVYQIGRDPNPDHPVYCNSEKSGPMKNGELKALPGCLRAECLSDGSIEIASCGVMMISTPTGIRRCYPSKDNKEPYPDCCKPDICKG